MTVDVNTQPNHPNAYHHPSLRLFYTRLLERHQYPMLTEIHRFFIKSEREFAYVLSEIHLELRQMNMTTKVRVPMKHKNMHNNRNKNRLCSRYLRGTQVLTILIVLV